MVGPGHADHVGLERSLDRGEWVRARGPVEGVETLEARFTGRAFAAHRHDTYAVGVTDVGVQTFDYRGRTEHSLPGQVVVLHPDETHDGRAGAGSTFGYRIVYVEPARIAEAVRALRGAPSPLPFVRRPVSTSPALAAAVSSAVRADLEPLALDTLVLRLAEGLLAASSDGVPEHPPLRLDLPALERGLGYLAHAVRVVRSQELEAVSGLSRYEFARQFRALYGTSPYRYSVMRRLDRARRRLRDGVPLADVAVGLGFADQAHFTRLFKAAYGMTPGRYARLAATPPPALASGRR
ncbi:MAG TPA: AraC family transcriptional regulator [Candidatus Limnocylindrales bacterium]|nr:AraC family transcriptional regulator [Candidatus Limnocylindrales bacterium]